MDSGRRSGFRYCRGPFDTAAPSDQLTLWPQCNQNISAMMKPNNVIMQVNIMDGLKGGDIGDFNVTHSYIHPTYQAIEGCQ